MALISFENLTKAFGGSTLFSGISLEADKRHID